MNVRLFVLAALASLAAWAAAAQTVQLNCTYTPNQTTTGPTTATLSCPNSTVTLPALPVTPPIPPIPPSSGCQPPQTFADGSTTDGCSAAPSPGIPQLAGLLATYGVNRTKWSVAGVDYYVGPPATLTLKDPSKTPPTGCTFSAPTLTCQGSRITVQGYDFSLNGGMKLVIMGAGNVVTQNKWVMAPNCSDPLIYISIDANSTLTITQNWLDNSGPLCVSNPAQTFGSVLFSNRFNDGGTLILEYNYFKDTFQHSMELFGAPNVAARVQVRYNAFNIIGYGGHPDGVQFNGGKFDKSLIAFNTFYHSLAPPGTITSQPLHVESQLTASLTNTTVAYNTVLAPGSCNQGANYPVGCSANIAIACKLDAPVPPNVNSGFKAYGNRIDWSGAIVALQNNGCTSALWGAATGFETNLDVKTGGVLVP